MRDGGGAHRVGDVLGKILERGGLKETLDRQSVLEEWSERVGPAIARVTRARSLEGSTLVVEVRSSPWLMELDMMKVEILDRLNRDRDLPVERLVFVLSPDV